jgi:hypothetical protein
MIIENKLYAPFKNYSPNLISSKYNDVSAIRGNKAHKGTDFAIPSGTEILSPADGVIKTSQITAGNCGGLIEIIHPDNIITRYCHLKKLNVYPNDKVAAGQVIALSGGAKNDIGSGRSTGAHLHFEVLMNNQFVNPESYLSGGVAIYTGSTTGNTTGSTSSYEFGNTTDKSSKSYNLSNDGSTEKSNKSYNMSQSKEKEELPESIQRDINNINKLIKESYIYESDDLTDFGEKLVNSFADRKNSEFSDQYTYEPIGKKLYCRFEFCEISDNKKVDCYEMVVHEKGDKYTIIICTDKIDIERQRTRFGEKIGTIDSNNNNYSVSATFGFGGKVKLTGGTKKDKKPYEFKRGGTEKSNTTYKLGVGGTEKSKTPYDLGVGGTEKSNTTYKLGVGGTEKSDNSYEFRKMSITKEAIDEINRILEIL